ncbi:MAG: class I tRNA ligase family protein, partial [Lachnospiraceae bacterium]|nr:class I tRNA ligase family protein [Lachnospiraceae bacterium]
EKYVLGVAVQKIYYLIWTEFCEWYIEMVKPRLYANEENPISANAAFWTLKTVLLDSLKLLHPYMPFITEEIFCTLQSEEESIMISPWPEYQEKWHDPDAETGIELAKNLIRGIRNIRSEMNVQPSRKAKVYIVADDAETAKRLEDLRNVYFHLISASDVMVQQDKTGIEDNAVSVVIDKAVIYMPVSDLVDLEKEKERLTKEKKRLEGELKRVHGMLGNEKFMSKAPEQKIAEEREKLTKYESMMSKVEEELAALGQ